jgi:hypothetical protein
LLANFPWKRQLKCALPFYSSMSNFINKAAFIFSLFIRHTHNCSHKDIHTCTILYLSHIYTITHSLTLKYIHIFSLTHKRTHTHCYLSFSIFLSLTHTHTHLHTHTHTHYLNLYSSRLFQTVIAHSAQKPHQVRSLTFTQMRFLDQPNKLYRFAEQRQKFIRTKTRHSQQRFCSCLSLR